MVQSVTRRTRTCNTTKIGIKAAKTNDAFEVVVPCRMRHASQRIRPRQYLLIETVRCARKTNPRCEQSVSFSPQRPRTKVSIETIDIRLRIAGPSPRTRLFAGDVELAGSARRRHFDGHIGSFRIPILFREAQFHQGTFLADGPFNRILYAMARDQDNQTLHSNCFPYEMRVGLAHLRGLGVLHQRVEPNSLFSSNRANSRLFRRDDT